MDTAQRLARIEAIEQDPSYRLADEDAAYLDSNPARALRFQLELARVEAYLEARGVNATVVVFGSARTVEPARARADLEGARAAGAPPAEILLAERAVRYAAYYEQAREFARLMSVARTPGGDEYVVVTGGGPGIMEAANRGAAEAGRTSVGFNVSLPREQRPNPFVTPGLCFRFRYFALRKLHFMLRARALVVFPGGFGTFDELFEALTLVQTGRMAAMPIVLVGASFWRRAVDLEFLAAEGMIDARDRARVTVVDSGAAAAQAVLAFHAAAGAAGRAAPQGGL